MRWSFHPIVSPLPQRRPSPSLGMSPVVKNGNSTSTTLPVAASLTTTCRLIAPPPQHSQSVSARSRQSCAPLPLQRQHAPILFHRAQITVEQPLPVNLGRIQPPRAGLGQSRHRHVQRRGPHLAHPPPPCRSRCAAGLSAAAARRVQAVAASPAPAPPGPATPWAGCVAGRAARGGVALPRRRRRCHCYRGGFDEGLSVSLQIRAWWWAWFGFVWRLASHWVLAPLGEASWTVSCTQYMFSDIVVCRD